MTKSADPLANEPRPLLCRLIGHRWKMSHVLEGELGQKSERWVYVDHVCTRCYATQKRSLWPTR
jgi:hypothetical protein